MSFAFCFLSRAAFHFLSRSFSFSVFSPSGPCPVCCCVVTRPVLLSKWGGRGCPSVLLLCFRLQQSLLPLSRGVPAAATRTFLPVKVLAGNRILTCASQWLTNARNACNLRYFCAVIDCFLMCFMSESLIPPMRNLDIVFYLFFAVSFPHLKLQMCLLVVIGADCQRHLSFVNMHWNYQM